MTDGKSGRDQVAMALMANPTQALVPVTTPDGTIVGVQIGNQVIPIQAPSAPARVLPRVPLAEVTADLVDASRQLFGTLQQQRYLVRAVREMDSSDQPLGRPRKAWANFLDDMDHNRTREELIRASRRQLTDLANQAHRIEMEQVEYLAGRFAFDQQLEQERLHLPVLRQRYELETEFREFERERQHALEVLDRTHSQEQYLALVQAGQQLPDLMRELKELETRNPAAAVETTLALMKSAMSTYEAMVTTTDKTAQAQMAEVLKPMMTLVIQKALGELRKGGA